MSDRGKVPSNFQGRSVQSSGMMRHGPLPGLDGPGSCRPMEPLPPPEILEKQLTVQEAEIDQLAADNHRLAATHAALREDLAAVQQEIQKIKAHIRSIQTESDIQIRVLMEKISKMGADIRAGEGVKKELQQAHMEAHSLVASRQELTTQIQKATQELQKIRSDVKRLPDMHAELDSLREEHQRLRAAFEYGKGLNIEQVEKMQGMEKNMVGMAREVEKLRAEVLNAEKRARVPHYGGTYANPDASYPPASYPSASYPSASYPSASFPPPGGSAAYVDGYGRPYPQMGASFTGENPTPYSATNGLANSGGLCGAPVPPYS